MKRLLFFAAKLGYQTRAFDSAARKLGVELVYVTDRCHQLDDPWRDHALPVHFESPKEAARAVLESQRGKQVDGILVLGDRPGPTAAYAAPGLGILHNLPASVEAARNKLRAREVLRDAALPVPWFRQIPLVPIPEPAFLGMQYPCVLKPLSLSTSQGVIRANNREEFLSAAARIKRLLEGPEIRATREAYLDQILVEGYLPGAEVAVEALLTEGALRILAIFDKPDLLEGPYFEETIYVTPSRLSESQQRAIGDSLQAAVHAFGFVHGPIHAEFRINETGVWPIEIAPRPIGGLCARSLQFQLASSNERIGLEELLLRHAVELPGGYAPRESAASGVMMIPVPRSGILEKVEGQESAQKTPGVTSIEITARIHDHIAAWPDGSSYLGFIFAHAETPAEVELALRIAHAQLRFTIAPRLPVEHPVTGKIHTTGS
jgi:biotin carboxylase